MLWKSRDVRWDWDVRGLTCFWFSVLVLMGSYLRPVARLLCLCASISLPQLVVSSLSLAPLCCVHTALQAWSRSEAVSARWCICVSYYVWSSELSSVSRFAAPYVMLEKPFRVFWLSNASLPEAKEYCLWRVGSLRQTGVFQSVEHKLPSFYTLEIQNCPRFWQLQGAVHRFHIDMEAFR